MVESGGLLSVGSYRVEQDWSDLAAAAAAAESQSSSNLIGADSKAMVFPVVMYGCESWTGKNAEHWKFDAFELWFWGTHLSVHWIASRSSQSILKEISPQCSLEGLILKLKLQFFRHLMQIVDWLEKILMLGGIGCGSRRGWQRMKWLYGIAYSMDMSLSKLPVLVIDREAWRAVIHGVSKSQTWLSDWAELNLPFHLYTPQCPHIYIYQ